MYKYDDINKEIFKSSLLITEISGVTIFAVTLALYYIQHPNQLISLIIALMPLLISEVSRSYYNLLADESKLNSFKYYQKLINFITSMVSVILIAIVIFLEVLRYKNLLVVDNGLIFLMLVLIFFIGSSFYSGFNLLRKLINKNPHQKLGLRRNKIHYLKNKNRI